MAGPQRRTALLVIDMQNDFVLPGGPMHVLGAPAIVPAVQKSVETARRHGHFIVWVVREHDASARDVELFRRHLYDGETGPTCKGESGAALVDGLIPQPGEHIQRKFRFSAFFATNLDLVLRRAGISHLVIVGVQTPNCIRATVFDAIALDYAVTVIADATAAASPEIHAGKEELTFRTALAAAFRTVSLALILLLVGNLLDMRNVSAATPTLEEWAKLAG
ncbi:probable inactive nicotinamidase At3g16190 isoform X1 [Selaginella moellendorffii]|uniref:probable inactive nicotinamidase At3g16190 isoform X1 n=1 Tax=Selaginella moellendorffii TaxID=88036 RepID=UPI000D1D0A25|nr:probable inactive nicotinamidase At3g16190 isoform X1 [Selaginella moellendorffii]|eukprot:XP_024517726.1 probable inactive nicotinamidase At3g16190 isoform X1 [Selaginella moellendorffii]